MATNGLDAMQLSTLALGLTDLGTGIAGYKLQQAASEYTALTAGINRDWARIQAADIRERGDRAARDLLKRGKVLQGSQRAALAAQGVVVDSGSALDVQVDTQTQIALDANQIKSNAWRQAWGFEVGADNEYAQAKLKSGAESASAKMTALTGGARALQSGLAYTGDVYSKRSTKGGK